MTSRTRSHPTLTPLTTLPTSPSYIYPTTSIPTTPSLLSRPSSTTRLRPLQSTPQAIHPSTKSKSFSTTTQTKRRQRGARRSDGDGEGEDWLTRTASAISIRGLEEKGQSWLVARNSSTSLDGGGDEDPDFHNRPAYTPNRTRSHINSSQPSYSEHPSRRTSNTQTQRDSNTEQDVIKPDFIDVDEDFDNDEGAEEGEELADIDEGEMRRVVMGRVGGWIDWAVGWMDVRDFGEGEEDGGDDYDDEVIEAEGKEGKEKGRGELDATELGERLRGKGVRRDGHGEESAAVVGGLKAPDGKEVGVWSDAKWLLKVAREVVV